jgi:hypothetical protein
MWWRRGALCLFGIEGAAFQYFVPDYPILPLSVQQRPLNPTERLACLEAREALLLCDFVIKSLNSASDPG